MRFILDTHSFGFLPETIGCGGSETGFLCKVRWGDRELS